jgi:Transposase and inactivated derivatives
MTKADYYQPLFKDQIYHIYNRGNGKDPIFYTDANCHYFLKRYDYYLSELVETFVFCLLPNHFHLLVRIKTEFPELVSEQFRKLFISYSMSINKQEQRRGNLFQRAFKRKLIKDEKYFAAVVYYIHANPMLHGIVDDFRKYSFSSYHRFIDGKKTKLATEEVLSWFGGKESFGRFHNNLKKRHHFDEEYVIEG